MAISLEDLKELHDSAYDRGITPRDKSSDDLVFYHVDQWGSSGLSDTNLAYRGTFDIIRKAVRQVLADLTANPVQVDFTPTNDDNDTGADLIDGIYRTSCRNNTSKESFDTAAMESVICGVGAWEIVNEYKTSRSGDVTQIISRRPIYEACNTVFWDPNAKLIDKSDAEYCSVLARYSEDGYVALVKELTGEDVEFSNANFKSPNVSYEWPWIADDNHVWVATFYHRDVEQVTSYVLEDLFGNQAVFAEEEIDGELQQLLDAGYTLVAERKYDQPVVTRYVASGERILEETRVPGTEIPVIPEYGERAVVEGTEIYEGIVRLAKDPQRLRNFQLSYLADIVSKSPRPKPIWLSEQLQGLTHMHEEPGADNNFPYLLQQRLAADGSELPLGPVGQTPEQTMPLALVQSIELSRQAVEDVAGAASMTELADVDLSGKAVIALQGRLDQQSVIYQDHHKYALRRDGEVFASMAREVYDSPRQVTITKKDGTQQSAMVMDTIFNSETGKRETINDLTGIEWEVYASIGPSYTNQKQQTREELKELIGSMPPQDPMRNILLLEYVRLMEGAGMESIRDYANRQLVMQGVREPETPEEQQALQQAQQAQKPGLEEMEGQARLMEGQAAIKNEENDALRNQIEDFKAKTGRLKVVSDAEIAGVKLDLDKAAIGMKGAETAAGIKKTNADTLKSKTDAASTMAAAMQGTVLTYDAASGGFTGA